MIVPFVVIIWLLCTVWNKLKYRHWKFRTLCWMLTSANLVGADCMCLCIYARFYSLTWRKQTERALEKRKIPHHRTSKRTRTFWWNITFTQMIFIKNKTKSIYLYMYVENTYRNELRNGTPLISNNKQTNKQTNRSTLF